MNYQTVDSFCNDVESLFSDFSWPYRAVSLYDDNGLPDGIGETDGELSLSEADVTVSQLLDTYIPKCLDEYLDSITVRTGHRRQYPDIDLSGGALPDSPISLDVKTALRDADNLRRLNAPISVGTHGRYFNQPKKNPAGIKRPYGSYEYHTILVFVYTIYDDYVDSSKRYVDDIQVACDEKWKFATKNSASGKRKYVASPTTVDGLISRDGAFDSRETFESYWRDPVGEGKSPEKQSGLTDWE